MSAPTVSMYSPAAEARIKALGLSMGKANLEVFAATLLGLASEDSSILVVTSDSRGSGKLGPFGQALPRQIVEVGIAEQNLVGIAAGLASCGMKVFAVSPACFLTARALEQIKNDLAYSDNPVTAVGISAGVSYGALGTTHHTLHDFASLRAINNIEIIVPADNAETVAAVRYAAAADRPIYLRFGKAALYDLPKLGKVPITAAAWVREGTDAIFIATGETVIHALLAAEELSATDGFSVGVLNVPSLRPFDIETLLPALRTARAVVTAEEHMVHGGLGEAVAALIAQEGIATRFRIAAIPDEYTVTGSQADIFRHYGLSMEGLAQRMRALLVPA